MNLQPDQSMLNANQSISKFLEKKFSDARLNIFL